MIKTSDKQSNATARALRTLSQNAIAEKSSITARQVSQKSERIMKLEKAVEQKIQKYSKLSFCDSSKHECDFNRDSYTDMSLAFSVSDKKYYKSCDRVDTLTLSRADAEQRVSKVSLFDRDAFLQEFSYDATYILCCNSKAVALNLCEHERMYSTLYRHLALYTRRADLYLMSAMSNSQRATCFKSSLFLKAVELQAKTLTAEQIQRATTSNKKYVAVVEQLKKLLLATKSAKTKTAQLVAVKKTKTAKLVAVK